MHSWLVTVLFLASATYSSGGAQVPITSYICTQPNLPGFKDLSQCNVSSGLRTCETKEGGSPTLLDGDTVRANGLYGWNGNINPFVVLDIPQGWCVGSVAMTFQATVPTLSLSVHTSERLSNNTDRTMFSIVSEEGSRPVVVNVSTLACGRYLRINMTSNRGFILTEIATFTSPSSVSASPVLSARPTTAVHSSSVTTTPMSSQPRTSDNSTTSGPGSTSSQSPSVSPSVIPVSPPSYVLPAAISVVAVLLLAVVLITIFVVIICIIARRHNTRKSLEMHRLSIHYRSTQRRKSSDITFKDDHLFVVDQSAEVPLHDANGAVNKSNDGEIRDTPRNYAALGPSESNHNVVQGAVEEPVAEGDISRPASQASIRSNEVSSKLTYGKVTWVHPSTLDHPYDSCNKEITMAASGGGGHYEAPPHWQPAEETYDLPPDCSTEGEVGKFSLVGGGTAGGGVLRLLQECQDELSGWHQIGDSTYDLPPDCKLPNVGAATDDRHKVLEDANATTSSQRGTTHLPAPQAPPSGWPIVDNTYEDTIAEVPKKRREPDPSSPTYSSVDPPSSLPKLAAARPSKHSNPPKPSCSAQSVSVSQEDHIYSVVEKSRKKPASSARSPPVGLTHSMDATHMYSEVDMSSKMSASSGTSPQAGLTHSMDATHVYSEVDMSSKMSASSGTSPQAGLMNSTDAMHVYSEVNESSKVDGKSTDTDALDDDFWGGSGNAEGDAMAQPQSITSCTTAEGAVPTQEIAMGNIYAEVDYSKKKKSKKSKKK